MSSSSSSATARSRSHSPATPDASDSRDPVVVDSEADFGWLGQDKLSPRSSNGIDADTWDHDTTMFFSPPTSSKLSDPTGSLTYQDLIHEDMFDEPLITTFGPPSSHPSPSYSDGMGSSHPGPSPLGPAFAIPDFLASPHFHLPMHGAHTIVTSAASPRPSEDGNSGAMLSGPPTPGPASAAVPGNLVFPPRESCFNLPIVIPNIPEHGTKSRVETQIRVVVDLATAASGNYDRIGSWGWLKLPKGTSTKKRTRKEGKIAPTPEDVLQLGIEVICASPPHTRVLSCQSCQNREAKRVARKIAARVRPPRSDSESPEDGAGSSLKPGHNEDTTSIVQFNCPEIIDFATGSAVLPLRITCYCRHHREKVGFRVRFTMRDAQQRVVGSGTTAPIMITDDHKSSGTAAAKKAGGAAPPVEGPVGRKDGGAGAQTPATRKRTKPYDGRPDGRKNSTVLESPVSAFPSLPVTRAATPSSSVPLDPVAWMESLPPPPPVMPSVDPTSPWDPASPTSNVGLQEMMDTLAALVPKQPESAGQPIHSFLPTAPPSPELPTTQAQAHQLQQRPAQPFIFFPTHPAAGVALPQPTPAIHRLVPAKGPTAGGTEVTVLGAHFPAGVEIRCVFGDTPATATQRWSDNTLVCIVPPRVTPGVVPVWLEGVEKAPDATPAGNHPMFTYEDESDRALMELALQVLGLKLTGKVEDPKNVALRIVGNTGGANGEGSTSTVDVGGMMQVLNGTAQLEVRRLLGSQRRGEFERSMLRLLALLDVQVGGAEGMNMDQALSHPNEAGQTLLHLATLLGLPSLVDFVLARGIDADARDRNGYTALHFAALARSSSCARVLVAAGADLEVVNGAGRGPRELAPRNFFDGMHALGRTDEPASPAVGWDEEEAAWGDAEEDSEVECARPRRRAHHRRRTIDQSFVAPGTLLEKKEASAVPPYELPSAAEEKLVFAASGSSSAVDEKQQHEQQAAVLSYADVIQRVLTAQLQRSRGMLHLPNLPGMPAVPWGALPQIPMVFPVMVPGAGAWPAFLDKRSYSGDGGGNSAESEGGAGGARSTAMKAAQEWRAFWEKWMTQGVNVATIGVASEQELDDDAPPVYTPRQDEGVPEDEEDEDEQEKTQEKVEVESVEDEAESSQAVGSGVAYEEEVEEEYEYQTVISPGALVRKHEDRMLKWFWIPTLLIGFFWALCTVLSMALHGARAMVAVRTGIQI